MSRIPRLIIRDVQQFTLKGLRDMEYQWLDSAPPAIGDNIMLIGMMVSKVPTVAHLKEKYVNIPQFDATQHQTSMWKAAQKQKEWMENDSVTELKSLGSKRMSVFVSPVGVMVDGFVTEVHKIRRFVADISAFLPDRLTIKTVKINPDTHFITVGCTDFSINDCKKIVDTFDDIS